MTVPNENSVQPMADVIPPGEPRSSGSSRTLQGGQAGCLNRGVNTGSRSSPETSSAMIEYGKAGLLALSRRWSRQSEETSRGCMPRLFKPVEFLDHTSNRNLLETESHSVSRTSGAAESI